MTERLWCDKCGEQAAVPILYGEVGLEGWKQVARHGAVLGTGAATVTSPRWKCLRCDAYLWRYQVERAEDRERKRGKRLTRPGWQLEVLRVARAGYGRRGPDPDE